MNKKIDEKISRIISSVEHTIPDFIDRKLSQKLQHSRQKRPTSMLKLFLWYPATAIATLVFALFIVLPVIQKIAVATSEPIEEIKTVFELPEKNITIIWIQKKDFKLRRTDS